MTDQISENVDRGRFIAAVYQWAAFRESFNQSYRLLSATLLCAAFVECNYIPRITRENIHLQEKQSLVVSKCSVRLCALSKST